MKVNVVSLFAVLSSLFVVKALPANDNDLTVVTPSGPILGHIAPETNNTTREFLGIPFAKPPTGARRFASPERAAPFREVFNASDFGPTCWNSLLFLDLSGGLPSPIELPTPPVQSEDCLSVNVWAPRKTNIPSKGTAVMLWIYGGGFALGGSFTPFYNGKFLAGNQDVVVVSFNRLNVFGFPDAPGQPAHEKNVGLLDVRAAVEWTRDNVAAFGGDPSRITLFGQSAGSAATDAYLYFAAEDPIIDGAILESGTVSVATTNVSLPAGSPPPASPWSILSATVNCTLTGTSSLAAAENLACMRKVPAATLINTINSGNLSFSPIPDNGTVFADSDERLATGRFARVPALVGSNDKEVPGNGTQIGVLETLLGFTCPASFEALGRSRFAETWQYRFFGNFPTGDPRFESPGPFHGSEITLVFGTYNTTTATPAQIASSKFLQSAWATFAKDPKHGLLHFEGGWPLLGSTNQSLIELNVGNIPRATFGSPATFDAVCPAM